MPTFNILTPSVRKCIGVLQKLKQPIYKEFIDVLDKEEPAIHFGSLAKEISNKVKGISLSEIQDIFFGISTLWDLHQNRDLALEELVNDLMRSVEKDSIENIKVKSNDEFDLLSSKILSLLKCDSLILSKKIGDIYYDHEKLFGVAEFEIDIRPVVEDNGSRFAVLSGEIRIDYRKGQDVESIYLGVDRDDIAAIKKSIISAERKIKEIESIIEKAGLKEIKA
jgi:hypothetical protein